jgi:hypothetical protein
MNQLYVDETFGNALESELVARVLKTSPARTRRRTRLWLSAGALAGAGLLGGIGAAAAGLFVHPGGEQVTPLATEVTETHMGTATLELGTAPEGATGIRIDLTCLTPGRLGLGGGAGVTCAAADIGTRSAWSGYTIPFTPGHNSVTITTEPESRWQLTAKYVKQERTEWGINAKGETYGVESPEKGSPDLIAVIATTGGSGYVYARELYGGPMPTSPEDATKNYPNPILREIPVYLSDGETQIGVFESGGGGGIPSYPSQSPALPTADVPASGH